MKARWFRTCGVLLACATLSTLVACGDDSTTDAGVAGTGASGTSASGTGGGGGTGGSKAGTGGGGSAALTCGGVACTVNTTLKSINPAAAACCTTDMKCGQYNTSMKCLQQNAPGTPDKSCPDIVVNLMGMTYPQVGCCTPAKKCGGTFSAVGWGCTAREDVDMAMGGPLMTLACGTAPDGGGDAGL